MNAMPAQHYSREELAGLGVRCGENVLVHRTVEFFGGNIQIGSDVRIDCHCVITSRERVVFGNHIHLGAAVHIFGSAGVVVEDYCGLSSRCSIFTTTDDYSGGFLTNPTVPDRYRQVRAGAVKLERHAIVGCGSVIMPGVVLGRGASVGAMSFVRKNVAAFMIMSGSPLRRIGMRNQERLEALEREHEEEKRRTKSAGNH
jgi:acetyltransferase-like isoleucine patch superfamily enzyme